MISNNRRCNIFGQFLFVLAMVTWGEGHAQSTGEDPVGFKGGYKALTRLCENNLDRAAGLLLNDYSRGYFVSVTIPGGADTVSDVLFLTAAPSELAREIAWALKGTNGQWIKREKSRKLLIPIFFCQNTPPNDSLFSQILVTNNAGFNIPGSPDQWPDVAEGVWIHPICRLIAGHSPRAPTPSSSPSGTAMVPAQQTAPPPANPAIAVPDSSANAGIYLTEADFDAGKLSYPTQFSIEEKNLLSWSSISYFTYSTVRARTSNSNAREYKEFPIGTIFGFKSDKVRYIYLKSGRRYLSVIYKGAPFSLFMLGEKQSNSADNNTLTGRFYYVAKLDAPLKEFSRKKIDEEFRSNPKMAADLQNLRKQLDDHSMALSTEDFGICVALAKECLAKYAQ